MFHIFQHGLHSKFSHTLINLIGESSSTPPPYEAPHRKLHTRVESFGIIPEATFSDQKIPIPTEFFSALFDFLLIDTFVRHIQTICSTNISDFQKLLLYLRKIHDIYLHIFEISIFQFPEVVNLSSLSSIKISNSPEVSNLFGYLSSLNNRDENIPHFCRKIAFDFLLIRPKKVFINRSKIKQVRPLGTFKSSVNSIAINQDGTILLVSTISDCQKNQSESFS